MGLKNSKNKKEMQDSIIFDKYDKKLTLIKDNDLGLDLILEKKNLINENVNFLNKKLKKIKLGIINKCNLPNKKKNILIEYNELWVFTYKELKDIFLSSNISNNEIEFIGECEILKPILTLNKKIYLKILFEKIKEIIDSIKYFKIIDLNLLITYINLTFENYEFDNFISQILNILKDKKNKVGKLEGYLEIDSDLYFSNIKNIFVLCLFIYEKTELLYEIQDIYEKKINKEILLNNMFFWLINYLKNEKKELYEYFENDWKKFNNEINETFSNKIILSKIQENKNNFFNLHQELIIIIRSIKNKIKNDFNILINPVKNKFEYNLKILLKKDIFNFYLKSENSSFFKSIANNLTVIIIQGKSPFNIGYVKKLIGFKFNIKWYSSIVYCILTLYFYNLLKIFKKKNYLNFNVLKNIMNSIIKVILSKEFKNNRDNQFYYKIDDMGLEIENNINIEELLKKYKKEKNIYLKEYINNNYSLDLHLFLICSIFIAINKVKIKYFNGNITINIDEYNSIHRLSFIHFLRYFKNFDYGYSNYSILNYLENNFLTIINQKKTNEIHINDIQSLIFNNYKAEVQKNLISNADKLKSYLEYSMNYDFKQVFDLDYWFNSNKFIKTFYFFKRLNNVNSKFVNLMIPGFFSYSKNIETYYKDLLNIKKESCFVLFKWAAFDKNIKKISIDDYDFANLIKKDFFNIGINLISKDYYELLFNDNDFIPGYKLSLYYMAIIAGKTLAFLITEGCYFGNRIISLWGNGMGSVVAYYCLKDLFRLNKSHLVYNIIFIGGFQCFFDLDPEVMKWFIGSVYNIYSINDSNLRYLNNLSQFVKSPVGLRELNNDNYSIKYYNLNLSDKVVYNFEYYNKWKEIVNFITHSENYSFIYNKINK